MRGRINDDCPVECKGGAVYERIVVTVYALQGAKAPQRRSSRPSAP